MRTAPVHVVRSPPLAAWQAFLDAHPRASVFHTPAMVDAFRAAARHDPLVIAALDAEGAVAALAVAVRVQAVRGAPRSLTSRSIMYAEPLCHEEPESVAALSAVLAEHDAIVARHVLLTEVRSLGPPAAERAALERQGYVHEPHLNFLIDLSRDPSALWSAMTSPCRKNIRRSWRRGVRIEEATDERGVDLLYRFCRLSFARARVPLADRSLFDAALRTLRRHEGIRIFVALLDGVPIGAHAVTVHRDTMFQWFGGSERVKGVFPVECLTWHEIEWGAEHGLRRFDFGGAGHPDRPYGVREFKAKFGGELVNYGRYRKVHSDVRLAVAETAYGLSRRVPGPEAARSWLRDRRRRGSV